MQLWRGVKPVARSARGLRRSFSVFNQTGDPSPKSKIQYTLEGAAPRYTIAMHNFKKQTCDVPNLRRDTPQDLEHRSCWRCDHQLLLLQARTSYEYTETSLTLDPHFRIRRHHRLA